MSEHLAPPEVDLTALPFDQYQRYRIAATMAELFRESEPSRRLRILDVGGFFRLIDRRVVFPIALFLPADATVTIDLTHHSIHERDASSRRRHYVRGDGAFLPFPDASFDVVVSCDTLEHVPQTQRSAFLAELSRVSADGLIIAAPFFSEAAQLAEEIVLEYYRQQFGHEQPQLEEHRTLGLPLQEVVRSWLQQQGMGFVEFPSGYLDHWLTMMLVKSHLFARPDLDRFHGLVDRYYNLRLFEVDQRSPAYRHFFVATKLQDPAIFARAAEETIPRAPANLETEASLVEGLWEVIRLADRLTPQVDPDVAMRELQHLRRVVSRALPPLRINASSARSGVRGTPEGKGVLLVAPDTVGAVMAGPGIRYRELSRALARRGLSVTLATPNQDPPAVEGVAVRPVTGAAQVAGLARGHNVAVIQGFGLVNHPDLGRAVWDSGCHLVADLYGPFHLEGLERASGSSIDETGREWAYGLSVLGEQLKLADFFICASERQRDYWLGLLTGYHRVNPQTYRDDRDMRRLIDVVPFGLAELQPCQGRAVLRGTHPGLVSEDKLILWTGGLWDWLDPFSLIRAVARIAQERSDVKLFVPRYPERRVAMPRWTTQERAIALCQELGVYGKSVHFFPWLPYESWIDCLCEADVAVSLHAEETLESRYAFRTRHLDCIAAGLPMVVTRGDVLSEFVEDRRLGYTVAPGDVDGLTSAILALLREDDPRGSRAGAFSEARQTYSWDRVVEPLALYCQSPWRAADLASGEYQNLLSTAWEQVVRDAADAERVLAQCQMQLAERQDVIEGYERGRVMRLMTGVQRRIQRLRSRD
jgi:glycosyltransferase involved in cell wall biosynthesis